MPDRRTQILALLDTRHDHLPTPTRRDDRIRAGFVHDTIAPQVCPTCDGVDPHCLDCRGRGEIEVRRHRDPYATNAAEGHGLAGRMERDQQLTSAITTAERELARLGVDRPATERDTVEEANQHPYGWEEARRIMYRDFDYHALDLALERLAGLAIAAHSERGLELLDRWLPRPLRAPDPPREKPVVNVAAKGRGADPRARRQRDDAIFGMVAAGHAYGHIARTVGLSQRQLRRIMAAQDRLDDAAA